MSILLNRFSPAKSIIIWFADERRRPGFGFIVDYLEFIVDFSPFIVDFFEFIVDFSRFIVDFHQFIVDSPFLLKNSSRLINCF